MQTPANPFKKALQQRQAQIGLWLNLAHGDGGWSLASGCARELAQQLVGSESALTPTDLLHFAPSGA